MHAGGANAAQRADGPGELALDRAAQVDVGQEVAGGERAGIVEQLVADRAADRHALLGQRHAQPQGVAAGHHDGVAARAQPERHLHGLETTDQLLRVGELQAGEQQGVGILGRPVHDIGEEAEQAARDDPERKDPAGTKRARQLDPRRGGDSGRVLRRAGLALDDRGPLLHTLQPRAKPCSDRAKLAAVR